MAITASVLRGGTNEYQTEADQVSRLSYWFFSDGVPPIGSIGLSTNQKTGDFAVQAQSSPNKTVKIKSGKMVVTATPTSESARNFLVQLSADYDLSLSDNTTGSTKYDKILLALDADDIHEPPANGDLTEVTCLIVERHNAASEAVTATNAIELAEVTVANSYSSIADTAITEKRVPSYINDGAVRRDSLASDVKSELNTSWTPAGETITTGTNNIITGSTTLIASLEIGTKLAVLDDGVQVYGSVTAKPSSITATAVWGTATGEAHTLASGSTLTVPQFSHASSPVGFPSGLLNNKGFTKVISFTRDLAAAGADVAYTGVGFKPSSLIAFGGSLTSLLSMGASDSGKTVKSILQYWDGITGSDTAGLCLFSTSAEVYHKAVVKSYDDDGFTLTWTKNGSPTGTITMVVLCFG